MRLVIDGFKTRKDVEEFISWYEGQGEQDICYWLEERSDGGATSMNVDCKDTFPVKWEGDVACMILRVE